MRINMRIGALEAEQPKWYVGGRIRKWLVFMTRSVCRQRPGADYAGNDRYFREQNKEALGVGSFGRWILHPASSTYGFITTTPKLPWRNYDLLGTLTRALSVPAGFDTDVNAAALGEARFGAAKGLRSAIYITIGTGIGVGVLSE